MAEPLRIGTAGWSLPADVRERFGPGPTGLARYATRFSAVEINSTFYRPHRPETFFRWAESTPEDFRFALKAPKSVTHERRLVDTGSLFAAFIEQTAALGPKRGPVLVQLPPSLAFDAAIVEAFFESVRQLYAGPLALDPRHKSWFADGVDALLRSFSIARVAADPPRAPEDVRPGGFAGLGYWRLHGSPRMYASSYEEGRLEALRLELERFQGEAWCILDNTLSGAAARNALWMTER